MSTVGRGGQGDVGQRIRDEILVIQRNNDCSGGMMEEWHQKLHNNTSPDDVVIFQALIDYVKSDFNMNVYWNTLISNGVTKERLASYDRKICSEPRFRSDQKGGLIRDLTTYLRTLKAVHSGADLESAIATCMGYSAQGHGLMGGVQIHPISGLSSELPGLLKYILEHIEDKRVDPLLEGLLEAWFELRSSLLKPHNRLKDIIFLDLSLDSTVRTAIERGFEELNNAQPSEIIFFITMVLENLSLSSDNNEELIYCLKDWYRTLDLCNSKADQWASKWNERAYFSTRKEKIDHNDLCMAVLVQEIISADYAFVIHTTNPSTGDSSEIYAEIVKGLGETLVGAYPGRAMSFVTKKSDLNQAKVLGSFQQTDRTLHQTVYYLQI
jgi:alpha-glucan,water dikinase